MAKVVRIGGAGGFLGDSSVAALGSAPTYVAMCHIFADSIEAFQGAFGPHAQEIMGDIPNYTDLQPVMQVSEVTVENSAGAR